VSTEGDAALSGEDRLIAQYFRPLARHPGALDLRDDAACFTPPEGADLVLTKDAVVAGVHFLADDAPAKIAQKALRVNLSDLAAKGADPAGFLLALALPEAIDAAWLAAFSGGLARDVETYRCPLFGGDTVRTAGPLMVSITAFGTLPRGTMVHRSGAQAGDRIFVSGAIGDAALGLRLRRDAGQGSAWKLQAADSDYLLDRYLLPRPRNALAKAVRAHASAAMDVSDGLVGDLGKLCRESAVSASIDVGEVPLSAAAKAVLTADPDMLATALTGGDDYEIVCTVADASVSAFTAAASGAGVPVAEIGRVVAGSDQPRFVHNGTSMQFARGSFSHF
jgi:thiamine-monophosphate kinase